jgi:hypothetical protein
MDQSQQEIKPPPVSAETAGMVIKGDRAKPESAAIIDALRKLPVAVDTVAGASHIPESLQRSIVQALFGETTTNPQLLTLRKSIEGKIMNIAKATENSPLRPYQEALQTELERAILQTPGLAEFYTSLSSDTDKKAFLANILNTGLMQAAARRLFIERITIPTEASQYEAVQQELNEFQQRRDQISKEINSLNKSITGKDVSQVTAEKTTLERSLQLLESQRQTAAKTVEAIQTRMSAIMAQYRRSSQGDLNNVLANDPEYQKLKADLTAAEQTESDLRTRIEGINTDIGDRELVLQQFARLDALQKQLDQLDVQIAQKRTEATTAREALLRKVAELGVELDKILPAAAKEALQQMMQRINEANKVRLENEARQKEESAQKEGDMVKSIQAKIEAVIVRRYQERYVRRRFLRSDTLGFRINEQLLIKDFAEMMTQGADAFVDSLLQDNNFRTSLGLSQDEEKFLEESNNRRKIVEAAKQTVFTSLSRDGILHLKLDEQTIRTLASTPEFIGAVDAAIAQDVKIKEQLEKLVGQKLDSKEAIKRAWERLPVGGLLGIIMLILLGVGKLLFLKNE